MAFAFRFRCQYVGGCDEFLLFAVQSFLDHIEMQKHRIGGNEELIYLCAILMKGERGVGVEKVEKFRSRGARRRHDFDAKMQKNGIFSWWKIWNNNEMVCTEFVSCDN